MREYGTSTRANCRYPADQSSRVPVLRNRSETTPDENICLLKPLEPLLQLQDRIVMNKADTWPSFDQLTLQRKSSCEKGDISQEGYDSEAPLSGQGHQFKCMKELSSVSKAIAGRM